MFELEPTLGLCLGAFQRSAEGALDNAIAQGESQDLDSVAPEVGDENPEPPLKRRRSKAKKRHQTCHIHGQVWNTLNLVIVEAGQDN
eukprot:260245-Amphidinium_carterae.1